MNLTNALNEIPFVTSIKLQHVAALGCHPQGVKESRIKEYKFKMILLGFLEDGTPVPNMLLSLILVTKCVLPSATVC